MGNRLSANAVHRLCLQPQSLHDCTTNCPAKPCALHQQSAHVYDLRYAPNNEEFLYVRLRMNCMFVASTAIQV